MGTYTVDVTVARNGGCQQGGSPHSDTAWSYGGELGANVELRDQRRLNVKVKVTQGTAAGGRFTLTATPTVTCQCIGTNANVPCQVQPNTVTITTS